MSTINFQYSNVTVRITANYFSLESFFVFIKCNGDFISHTISTIGNNVVIGNDISIITDDYTTTRCSLFGLNLWTKIEELVKQVFHSSITTTAGKFITDLTGRYLCFDMYYSRYRCIGGLCKIYWFARSSCGHIVEKS